MKQKRWFVIVTIFALLCCLMPQEARADEVNAARITKSDGTSREYQTLADAVAEAEMGDTITLLADNSETITPDTAFYLEGAAFNGTISEESSQKYCLETLDETAHRYIVNGYAETILGVGTDNQKSYTGTLNQVFCTLRDDTSQWTAIAWNGNPNTSNYGVGLYGDTILTADLPSMSNRGWSSTMSVVVLDSLTLDLNGHSYTQVEKPFTGWGGYAAIELGWQNSPDLVLRDSAGGGCITGAAYAVHMGSGTFTLESGTLQSDSSTHGVNYGYECTVFMDGNSTFHMNGGTVHNSGQYDDPVSGAIRLRNSNNIVNITGGELQYGTSASGSAVGLFSVRENTENDQDSKGNQIYISGNPTLTGDLGDSLYSTYTDESGNTVKRVEVVISGGSFNGTGMDAYFGRVDMDVVVNKCLQDNGNGELTVTEHDLEITEPTADCVTEGTRRIIYCKRCGHYFLTEECMEEITEEQAKETVVLGHEWEESFTVDQEATCTTEGSRSVHCKHCDGRKYSLAIPASGHSYGKWQTETAPTCTEKGSSKRVCSVCQNQETRELDAAGHEWEEAFTVDQEAACTTEGSRSVHCKNCDAKKYRLAIPASGHVWDAGSITREPSGTEEGEMLYTCTVCGETRTETIAKKPADMPDTPDTPNTPDMPDTLDTPEIMGLKTGAGKRVVFVRITVGCVPGADHYEIYRVEDGKEEKAGTTKSGSRILIDKNNTKMSVQYYAVAVSRDGKRKSAKSALKSITLRKPAKITGVKRVSKGIRIRWKKVRNAKTYVIYRSESEDSGYRRITSIGRKRSSYVDKKAEQGKSYYYKIAVRGRSWTSLMSQASKCVKR